MNINWQAWLGKFAIAIAFNGFSVFCWNSTVLAQIIPDDTLGAESSVVKPDNIKEMESSRISGGAVRGNNLFHSFREFNIGEGRGGYFENPEAIENIFSRVTGSNPSNILGTLGVLGNANLFFLNPNGILFGANASLDLKGSFLATTADTIVFPDSNKFSATNPEAAPLLTVNVQQPIGLEFQKTETTATIENQSIAPAGKALRGQLVLTEEGTVENFITEESLFGLRVQDGENLLIIGGDIISDEGGFHAVNGKIELAAIAGEETIGLSIDNNNFSLSVPEEVTRGNIFLSKGAVVNTSGEGGGEINVWSKQLTLNQGSRIEASTLGEEAGKGIAIDSHESVTLQGTVVDTRFPNGLFDQTTLLSLSFGAGDAGDVTINTDNLSIEDGALVATNTYEQGNGGNIIIDASKSVQLIGFLEDSLYRSLLNTETYGAGSAGNVSITTSNLLMKDGGAIDAFTFSDSGGTGGNIAINASQVQLIGEAKSDTDGSISFFATVLSTATFGTEDAGDISIDADELIVKDGGSIDANTFNAGKGGSVTINVLGKIRLKGTFANREFPSGVAAFAFGTGNAGSISVTTSTLSIEDGALIGTNTFGSGKAGDIIVNAAESVQIIGFTESDRFITRFSNLNTETTDTGDGGNITVITPVLLIRDQGKILANGIVDSSGQTSGKSGKIILKIETAVVEEGGQINVDNQGTGRGGEIDFTAGSLTLDNDALISARTTSNLGGNIHLKIEDSLLMKNNSNISATAGIADTGGDGGNIDIDAPFIIALPNQNNNITANAFAGKGGKIIINTNGIFGIEFRNQETALSDITASSRFGQQGIVEINTSAVDPTRSLDSLPQQATETEVAQSCQETNNETTLEFFDIGRGGLPPTPEDLFSSDVIIAEWIPLDIETKVELIPDFTKNEISNFTVLHSFSCQK